MKAKEAIDRLESIKWAKTVVIKGGEQWDNSGKGLLTI